jgi:hypothetical protein
VFGTCTGVDGVAGVAGGAGGSEDLEGDLDGDGALERLNRPIMGDLEGDGARDRTECGRRGKHRVNS